MEVIKTEKLHWVAKSGGSTVRIYLGNQENQILGYPMLRGLTTEEQQRLTESGIAWEYDEGSSLYIHCFPGDERTKAIITAPLYIEEVMERITKYREAGLYTDKWTHPKDFKHVNVVLNRIIPKCKFHDDFGCYVEEW